MKIELFLTDCNQPVYVVYDAESKSDALRAVKRKRKAKESYAVKLGYVNDKDELYFKPEYGKTEVWAVYVRKEPS